MKRSSTHAALDYDADLGGDCGGGGIASSRTGSTSVSCAGGWNYHDDVLATSMMMVSICNDSDWFVPSSSLSSGAAATASLSSSSSSSAMADRRSSMGSTMSASSSRGSLVGWGTTASRKSYKVDLCALANHVEGGGAIVVSAGGGEEDDGTSHRHHHHRPTKPFPSTGGRSSSPTTVTGRTSPKLRSSKTSTDPSSSSTHDTVVDFEDDTWGFFVGL